MTHAELVKENEKLKRQLKKLSIECDWAIRHVGEYWWVPAELLKIQRKCERKFSKKERKMLYV